MEEIGFARGNGYPSVFSHKGTGVTVLVHGDDDVSVGEKEGLDWMKKDLERKYEIKTQRIGVRGGTQKEGKVMNRIIRRTERG